MDRDCHTCFELPSGQTVSLAEMEQVAVRRIPDQPELAREAVQIAALKLLKVRRLLDDPDRYAAKAVRNAINSLLRREIKQRQSHAPLDEIDTTVETLERGVASARFLHDLNKQLKGRLRVVVALLYSGLNKSQIAKKLNLSRQTIQEDLKKIKKIIIELGPPDPPTPKGGGGGGRKGRKRRGGVVLPPARADPLLWDVTTQTYQQLLLAVTRVASERKEVKRHERIELQDQSGGQRQMVDHHLALTSHSDLQTDTEVVSMKLKRLLLQLPAFREAGLAPTPELQVENLEQVLHLVLAGEGGPTRG